MMNLLLCQVENDSHNEIQEKYSLLGMQNDAEPVVAEMSIT